MLATARVWTGRDRHDLARRGVPRVAQARDGGALVDGRLRADGARDRTADHRLGDHLAVHASPIQVAMDARVVQEAAGPGRFLLGFGTSKIFLNNARMQTKEDARADARRGQDRPRRAGRGGVRVRGETWSASVPALPDEAEAPREVPPVYVAATAPKMQALAGEIADGCLTPSITTPAFVRYTRENVAGRHRHRLHGGRVDRRVRPRRGRDGAREIAGMYLANKVQNIQGSADTLLELAGIEQERPAGRRGDGARRPAGREGEGDRRRARPAASRSRGRRATASRRSRSTATRAVRT